MQKIIGIKNYLLAVFGLHMGIMATYVSITSYLLVHSEERDPIGTGIQQWIFFFIHLLITTLIFLVYNLLSKNRSFLMGRWLLNVAAILFWWVIYFVISSIIWKYL